MAAVFSRKPAYTAAAPESADGGDLRARLMAAAANPYIGASGAAFLFLLTLAVLVLVTGDPKAGAPVIRLSLSDIGATKGAPDGWREALAAEGAEEAPLLPGQMDLSTQPFARQASTEEAPEAFTDLAAAPVASGAPWSRPRCPACRPQAPAAARCR